MPSTKNNGRLRAIRRRIQAVQAQWLPGERRIRKANGQLRQAELYLLLAQQLGLSKLVPATK